MKNKFVVRDDGTVEIMLTQGKVAIIDEEDMALVGGRRWYAHKRNGSFYTATMIYRADGTRTLLSMHQLFLPEAKQIDHINRDGLDNRRINLRMCTPTQNQHNRGPMQGSSSKYKGVAWHKRRGKWQAYIKIGDKIRHLGVFTDELAAARAYDIAARQHFGEFARPNFDVLPIGA